MNDLDNAYRHIRALSLAMLNVIQTKDPSTKRNTILIKPIFSGASYINKGIISYEAQVAIWQVDNLQ